AQGGRVAGDEQHRDDRLAPALEIVADLLARADQRELLDQGARYPPCGLVLAPREVEILDLEYLLLIAHADRYVGVEVGALGSHAAEVERVEGAHRVDRPLDVIG